MKGLPRSMSRAVAARAQIIKRQIPFSKTIAVAGTSGVGFGTVVIDDLPEGNVLILGAVAYAQFSTADADVQAAFDGDYSIGSTATADATLSGGDADIIPSSALGAATAKVSPIVRGANATQAILDNTDGSLELNLNLIIDDANISGDADFVAEGILSIAYIVLGDD